MPKPWKIILRERAGGKQAANARFEQWIETQLATFELNHDAPNGVEPPVVPWHMGTIELNGGG